VPFFALLTGPALILIGDMRCALGMERRTRVHLALIQPWI
jgi:hypothetical protein